MSKIVDKKGLPKSKRKKGNAKRATKKGDVSFPSVYRKPTKTIDKSVVNPQKRKKKISYTM